MIAVSPSESEIFAALRSFLLTVLPQGVDVVRGQDNRVPEPAATSFVAMWPIMRPRLATNVEDAQDNVFTASIAGASMTVASVQGGAVLFDQAPLFGVGLAANSKVTSQTSGSPGGPGTYAVSPSQTVAQETMATGQILMTQETEIVVQLDVHAANLNAAGDMAETIATTFRSAYAADFFAADEGSEGQVSPLYCDDPRQSPFLNAEQQYESRWTVDVHLQANQTVLGVPMQFASILELDVVSVEAAYPPN